MDKVSLITRKILSKSVTLSHGSGGRETLEIIEKIIRELVPKRYWRYGEGTGLDLLDDSSLVPVGDTVLSFTIDSYTVSPIFFPGGDIGKLAAAGTINDLLMSGARPIVAADSIVVEEGFDVKELATVVSSMTTTFAENDVAVVGGDFKVVPRGKLDKMTITTAGIGLVVHPIRDDEIMDGDNIIVSGPVGSHGAAILSARGEYGIKVEVKSDVQPLTKLMLPLLEDFGESIHAAGDPTRGGVAMLLNEWASKNNALIRISEDSIPLDNAVRKYAELVGIDPLSLASEGVAVLAVSNLKAEEILHTIRSLGWRDASIIGIARKKVEEEYRGLVIAETSMGGYRVVEAPSGEIVPRIC